MELHSTCYDFVHPRTQTVPQSFSHIVIQRMRGNNAADDRTTIHATKTSSGTPEAQRIPKNSSSCALSTVRVERSQEGNSSQERCINPLGNFLMLLSTLPQTKMSSKRDHRQNHQGHIKLWQVHRGHTTPLLLERWSTGMST